MPRERTYRTEAVVIRRSDFGEADRLLTLFSADRGKTRAIAKGARKPQSRKTGHVELFMRSKFLIAEGRDLDIVTQAEMVEAYAPLRDDLVRATYASYAVELLDQTRLPGEVQVLGKADFRVPFRSLVLQCSGHFGDGQVDFAALTPQRLRAWNAR